ncbi:MAG: hypothetical protein KAX78_10450 [Phycisphaerae bacterium]|nr:hypothetical protein [Phycisphaerae bacterium]
MNLSNWIPAFATTSLLGIALWLLRSVILTRLRASVQHEFDQKLETIRASHHKSEEAFRADLRAKEAQIEALRSGAISGLTNRQAAMDRRRIEAVDQLWSSIISLRPAKAVSELMASLKFGAAAKVAAQSPNAREMFAAVGGQFDIQSIQKMKLTDAEKARPFVSEIAWALFSAYQTILRVALTKLELLKRGVDVPDIIDEEPIRRLVTVALPHKAEYVAKFDTGAYHYLLDELESRLLEEVRRMLQGVESDKQSIEQAGMIVGECDRVMASISESASR